MADVIEAKGIDFLVSMMQKQPAMGPQWELEAYPNMRADIGEYLKTLDPKALVTTLRGAQLTNLPPPDQLEAIHTPALILAWVDDPGHPVSSAEEVKRRLPNSTLLIAHNAAEVATWTGEIRDFVTSLS